MKLEIAPAAACEKCGSARGIVSGGNWATLEEISTSRPDDVARQRRWHRVRDDRADEPTGPFSRVGFGAVHQRGGDGKREPQHDEVQQRKYHPHVSLRPGTGRSPLVHEGQSVSRPTQGTSTLRWSMFRHVTVPVNTPPALAHFPRPRPFL